MAEFPADLPGGAVTIGVLTVSDKSSRGERDDVGGKVIRDIVQEAGALVGGYAIVPDDEDQIAAQIVEMSDDGGFDIILTTGGTGLSPRDVTPQATLRLVDHEVPGIAEAMRAASLAKTPAAMTSRAVAGMRGHTLIINLPGSPNGVRECLEVVLPALPHAVAVMRGSMGDHSRPTG